jgi:hypothetical protein
MRGITRLLVYLVFALLLGFALAWGVGLYVNFVLDESECQGFSWLGRAVCGDSVYLVLAACVLIAGIIIVGGDLLVRRLRDAMRR